MPSGEPQYFFCCPHGCRREATMQKSVAAAVDDWNTAEIKREVLDAEYVA
jgi:hypothetical protein